MNLRGAAAVGALAVTAAGSTVAPATPRRGLTAGLISVTGPVGDTLAAVTPAFTLRSAGFAANELPITLTLQVSARVDFLGPLLVDTSTVADSATITPGRALPDRTPVYWRARAVTALADTVVTDVVGPRISATWLRLIDPNAPNGTTVDSRRPTFTWRSAPVATPPGPWSYDLTITGPSPQPPIVIRQLPDSTFTPAFDLESNTPYRWSVTARLATGDSARVTSLASFVIVDANSPLVTLLYQNFPNPFPSATSATTCIWFDLNVASRVRLDIFDLRGNHVKTVFPTSAATDALPPGRYGRAVTTGSGAGCDPAFSWDGTTATGRTVPSGVYLLRMRTPLAESFRKIVFLGR
jgi:hypothetical protein